MSLFANFCLTNPSTKLIKMHSTAFIYELKLIRNTQFSIYRTTDLRSRLINKSTKRQMNSKLQEIETRSTYCVINANYLDMLCLKRNIILLCMATEIVKTSSTSICRLLDCSTIVLKIQSKMHSLDGTNKSIHKCVGYCFSS